jgi:hypothetical protein
MAGLVRLLAVESKVESASGRARFNFDPFVEQGAIEPSFHPISHINTDEIANRAHRQIRKLRQTVGQASSGIILQNQFVPGSRYWTKRDRPKDSAITVDPESQSRLSYVAGTRTRRKSPEAEF